ncbi:MarR family winged helix-turn-helix transcriptional regulator [Schumannella luteola]|uniref:MarR family winged helix-turn-helix transcriptional regulator n=1 Tax=Schumannella luteola TaxID=472059 RepID=UPI001FE5CD96|nr:MarR family transcriptional regulator [Schumannella luteola]
MSRLLEAVIDRETPILDAHELTMWEYAILTAISRAPDQSQRELAASSRRDATRLIRHLDTLSTRGLVRRDTDPGDRRRRVVNLTDAGATTLGSARRAIRRMEDELLAELPVEQRDQLRATLAAAVTLAAPAKSDPQL